MTISRQAESRMPKQLLPNLESSTDGAIHNVKMPEED